MMVGKNEWNAYLMSFWQTLEKFGILILKRNKGEKGIDGFGLELVLMIG